MTVEDAANTDLLWARPEWLEEAHAWIGDRLERRGVAQRGAIEQPHIRWWSTVLRVPTDAGDVYFKALSRIHHFEVGLTQALGRWVGDRVPALVAADLERGWMLMQDGGDRLREHVRSVGDLGRWEGVLPRYAELQIAVARHRDELLALGVPDQRLGGLPAAFARLLADRQAVGLGRPDGLTPDEIARHDELMPALAAMCERLAAAGVPETLQHDDLHDGNVFVADGAYRIFDWGDSCVSHPFHSLVVTLRSIAHRFDLEPGAAQLERLRDAYLEPWLPFGSRSELGAAFEVAYRTGTVARALAWGRFVSAREAPERGDDAGGAAYGLKLFLAGGPIGTWRS